MKCILESTLVARKLYESRGFKVERDFFVDAGQRFADRPKDHILFMIRARSGAQ